MHRPGEHADNKILQSFEAIVSDTYPHLAEGDIKKAMRWGCMAGAELVIETIITTTSFGDASDELMFHVIDKLHDEVERYKEKLSRDIAERN